MKVGTMPLAIQVPDMAPISKSMTIAVVTLPMLLFIASSKALQGVLNSHMLSQTARPAATRSATWLAPSIASLPKILMLSASMATRISTGISEMKPLAFPPEICIVLYIYQVIAANIQIF